MPAICLLFRNDFCPTDRAFRRLLSFWQVLLFFQSWSSVTVPTGFLVILTKVISSPVQSIWLGEGNALVFTDITTGWVKKKSEQRKMHLSGTYLNQSTCSNFKYICRGIFALFFFALSLWIIWCRLLAKVKLIYFKWNLYCAKMESMYMIHIQYNHKASKVLL